VANAAPLLENTPAQNLRVIKYRLGCAGLLRRNQTRKTKKQSHEKEEF